MKSFTFPRITVWRVIAVVLIAAGTAAAIARFTLGLGATTNLSDEFPWGLWIGFDVVTGVAFAGGAYVLCFVVYILRAEKYHAIIRATVLTGFLAYLF